MNKTIAFSGLLALGAMALNMGCAKQGSTTGGPEWVDHTSGIATYFGVKAVYAVGTGKSRIVQAARDEACGYARTAIGKYMKTQVNSIVEGSYKSSSDGADAENAGKTVKSGFSNSVDKELNAVGCVKNWKDPTDGTTYTLARWDAAAITDILKDVLKAQKSANNLSEELEKKNDQVHEEIMKKLEAKFGK